MQPGYDALADQYAAAFPTPYETPLAEHAVAAFADTVSQTHTDGVVVDVGCGLGLVTADLTRRGLTTIGMDPSERMLAWARNRHPALKFVQGDATLTALEDDVTIIAIIARFSLIHVDPAELPNVLQAWASRISEGALVLVACQSSDGPEEVSEFDHRVARAWRWTPDRLAAELSKAGFTEVWRITSRPDEDYRFPLLHMLARRHR
jgi:SAM-dependent methyltransferase